MPLKLLVIAAGLFGISVTNTLAESAAEVGGLEVTGVVWVSPTCAGAQREDEHCRAPRAGVQIRLMDSKGHKASSATTDENGVFKMSAPAGQYRLRVVGTSKVMRCPDLKISLPLAKPAMLDVECDSGMR